MLYDLIKKLVPVNETDSEVWAAMKKDYPCFSAESPCILWYISGGTDYHPVTHLGTPENAAEMEVPAVDLFLYSDYADFHWRDWKEPYDKGMPKCVFGDSHTRIHVTKLVPLAVSDPDFYRQHEKIKEEIRRNPEKFERKLDQPGFVDKMMEVCLETPFLVGELEVQSDQYKTRRHPILYAAMDNWGLLSILMTFGIKCDYICSVCDGCGFGGGYLCPTSRYEDFAHALKPGERYWITEADRHREIVDDNSRFIAQERLNHLSFLGNSRQSTLYRFQ